MLKSILWDYSDACILVRGTITFLEVEADNAARAADRDDKKVIFKNCVLFTDCITEIKKTHSRQFKKMDCCWCVI